MTTPDAPAADRRHDCVIVGCGPAGAMLGLLLARAGLDVLVLEKHGDFLRDFRGDTIHPATLELLDQLGLADRFLALPHAKVGRFGLAAGDTSITVDFARLPTKFPYIAFVPQWDFLDFVTGEARRYPGFRLVTNAEATGLVVEAGVVRGVRYRTADGERVALGRLTVGADGRTSVTRAAAGLRPVEFGAPMDVFWFRLPRRPDEPTTVQARAAPGRFGLMLNRGDQWQVGYLIPKGGAETVRADGIAAFRAAVAALLPELADRVGDLRDWDQIRLLTVQSNRLRRWWAPGYLAIGDAAHAMSPIGGVGINFAIQDAVEAANVLWRPLRDGRVSTADLATVQRHREVPTRLIQGLQSLLQAQVVAPNISGAADPGVGRPFRLALAAPFLRDLPARLIGLGVGRPRIASPEESGAGDRGSGGRAAAQA